MGVEPFLVGSSLVGVLAQRLVRVLCTHCREPYQATSEELNEAGIEPQSAPVTLYRARGCSNCAQTGYQGRVGIFELMLVEDSIRAMVSKNVDAKTIKKQAVAQGMGTLRLDGTRKVLSGMTSVAELMRATEEEGTIDQI